MTARRYRLGPVTLAVNAEGRAVEAFVRTLEPFRTDAPADGVVSLKARADEEGARTVPLPRVEGDLVIGAQLSARYDEASRTLHVERAEGTGELANAFRWLLGELLLERSALLIHGCGLSLGALFTGQSGAGKSTLGRAAADGGLTVLGDELVIVEDGLAPTLHGTPWNTGSPVSARLLLMGTLGWTKVPALSSIIPSELLRVASANVLLPRDEPRTRARVAQLLVSVIGKVRTARLDFAPTPDVAALLRAELPGR